MFDKSQCLNSGGFPALLVKPAGGYAVALAALNAISIPAKRVLEGVRAK
jgi:hypothetical protein